MEGLGDLLTMVIDHLQLVITLQVPSGGQRINQCSAKNRPTVTYTCGDEDLVGKNRRFQLLPSDFFGGASDLFRAEQSPPFG